VTEEPRRMKIIHLYTGDDGQSHFEDIELKSTSDRPSGVSVVELLSAVQGLSFTQVPPGWTADYHTAPRRQFVLHLTGKGEYTCGDGTSRIVGPGDILLADDLTGQGHRSREVEGPRQQAYIYLDPDFDLDTIRAD
jgi:hypothetical protein